MLSARNNQGDVLAWDVTKEDGPFTCPECKAYVLIKKGRIKAHHFAHIPPTDCAYGIGESEHHRRAKREIYETLSKNLSVTNLKIERYMGEVRPDISFYLNNVPVAIEVQISTLSLDTIDQRTRAYTKRGIYILWISPYDSRLTNEKYTPHAWEKYLHALYFGRVNYWLSNEEIQPICFDEYKLYVPGGYDVDGDYHGDYFKTSKRYKTPRFEERILITQMSGVQRKAWRSSTISIPEARLWCKPLS